jgi:hypothetical protein
MTEKKDEDIIKKEYPLIQKKYNLPSIENLEVDFGLIEADCEKYLLVNIRKKMHDKIEFFLGIISNIFEGDATLSNIYESKVFDEEKKTELFKIYKRLMKYSRQSNILSLYYDEKAEAEFINSFYKEWQNLKQNIKKNLAHFRDTWDLDTNVSDDILNYLG